MRTARRLRSRSGWVKRRGARKSFPDRLGELRQKISDLTPHTVPGFVNQKSPEVLEAVEWLKQRVWRLDDSGGGAGH